MVAILCRCELATERLDLVIFECVLNKKWTVMMMFCELERNVDFPLKNENLLCLCENQEKIAKSLKRFVLRYNNNI